MKRQHCLLWLVVSLLLALCLTGCAAAPAKMAKGAGESYGAADMAVEEERQSAAPVPAGAPTAPEVSYADHAVAQERMIIRTASLQLVVQETENTVAAIKALVVAQGGFVSSSNVWRSGNILQAQLTVRVPADRMDACLEEVKKLALRVERDESGGQDVTEEYVDLEAQLRNLEATETELRTLLTEVREKSGKAEDVMAVYRELVSIRGEIERIKGRVQYLERSVDLATINLQLSERQAEPIGQPGWQPLQTLRRALNALVELGKFGVDAAIWVIVLGGTLLGIPALVIWGIWRLTRRQRELRRKARAAEAELAQKDS